MDIWVVVWLKLNPRGGLRAVSSDTCKLINQDPLVIVNPGHMRMMRLDADYFVL